LGKRFQLIDFYNKTGRAFFNRETKNAFKKPTYRAFVQTMHTVIHKDCGQFFAARLSLATFVKRVRLLISKLAALIDAV
jgi:hypothetical protein